MDSLVTNLVDEHYLGTIQSIADEMRTTNAAIAAINKGNTGSTTKSQGLLSFRQPLTGGSTTRISDVLWLDEIMKCGFMSHPTIVAEMGAFTITERVDQLNLLFSNRTTN